MIKRGKQHLGTWTKTYSTKVHSKRNIAT